MFSSGEFYFVAPAQSRDIIIRTAYPSPTPVVRRPADSCVASDISLHTPYKVLTLL